MRKTRLQEHPFTPSLFDEDDFWPCRSDSTNAEGCAQEAAPSQEPTESAIATDNSRNAAFSVKEQKCRGEPTGHKSRSTAFMHPAATPFWGMTAPTENAFASANPRSAGDPVGFHQESSSYESASCESPGPEASSGLFAGMETGTPTKRIFHDEKIREKALELFQKDIGYRRVAASLGIPEGTARDWGRAFKRGTFSTKAKTRMLYDERVREKALELFKKGAGYKTVAAGVGVPVSIARDWGRAFKRGTFSTNPR